MTDHSVPVVYGDRDDAGVRCPLVRVTIGHQGSSVEPLTHWLVTVYVGEHELCWFTVEPDDDGTYPLSARALLLALQEEGLLGIAFE